MNRHRIVASIAALVIAGISVVAVSQDADRDHAKKGAPKEEATAEVGGMTMPEVTPEHKRLQTLVGEWDAEMEMHWGGPVMKVVGTETVRALGPFYVVSEFKADMGGMPFEGHGVFGYDPYTKKSTGYWFDVTSPVASESVGTYDASKKMLTMDMTGVDGSGKPMKMRETEEMPDNDTRIFHMYTVGEDGKETLGMKISYKRRK